VQVIYYTVVLVRVPQIIATDVVWCRFARGWVLLGVILRFWIEFWGQITLKLCLWTPMDHL